jgi:hypothetical protein
MATSIVILVNGERRSELALAVPKPIKGLRILSVECQESVGPRLYATSSDYHDGAYRLKESNAHAAVPGTYRAETAWLCYDDGRSVDVPLEDEIVITVPSRARRRAPTLRAL